MSAGHVAYGRRIDPAKLPRWLRPKLQRAQVRDLAMAHIVNLDALARGEADETILWQWMGGALTWQRIADTLQRANAVRYTEAAGAMAGQVLVCHAVIARRRAGQPITLQPDEYAMAVDAVDWMDALAEVVDQVTASAAADWAEREVNKMECAA